VGGQAHACPGRGSAPAPARQGGPQLVCGRDIPEGAGPLVLFVPRYRPEREPGRRAVQRAPRHGGRSGVLPLCQGGDRRDTGPGHDRRPRQLPPGDPDRARPGCAAPDQCLLEQQAGASRTTGASKVATGPCGASNAPDRPPGSAALTTNCATSSALAPATTNTCPPTAADCSTSGGPRPCWPSCKPHDSDWPHPSSDGTCWREP